MVCLFLPLHPEKASHITFYLFKYNFYDKKTAFCYCLFCGGGATPLIAQENIPMQIIKENGPGGGNTLAPPRPWYITQNDFSLTLPALADDYTLELRNEEDVVVYTTFVPAGTTLIVLPSTLSGDFELRLVGDTYYYRGYITL